MTRLAALMFAVVLAASAQSSIFSMRRAPGFSLPDAKQKQHDIQDFRGKVLLIDFMKTDCAVCAELTKVLESQIRPKYGDKIQMLSVVVPPDNVQTVARYVATHKVTSPVLFDCGQMMASYLQITPANPSVHFPRLAVIDRGGLIRKILEHTEMTPAQISAAIDAAMK